MGIEGNVRKRLEIMKIESGSSIRTGKRLGEETVKYESLTNLRENSKRSC